MEDLKIINGKVQLDDGSEIDFKTALMPETDYGDWIEDESITLIKAYLDHEPNSRVIDELVQVMAVCLAWATVFAEEHDESL